METRDLIEELVEEYEVSTEEENSTVYIFDRKKHATILLENLKRMHENELMVDLEMALRNGACFGFHSTLLAAASSYFRQIFVENRIHFHSGRLDIQDAADSSILEALQVYLYEPGKNFEVQQWDRLMEFAASFGFFQMVDGKGSLDGYLKNFEEMKDKCQLTYTVLQTETDDQFLCHGCIVAASSPELCQRLMSANFPANKGRLWLVFPAEIRSPAVSSILDYIYRAKFVVASDTVEAILSAACALRLPSMAEACVEFISRRLTPSKAVTYDILSTKLLATRDWMCLKELSQTTRSFLYANIEKVLETGAFALHATESDILRYFQFANLEEIGKEALLSALLRWRGASPDRNPAFARIVAIVCFELDCQGLNEAFTVFRQGRVNPKGSGPPGVNPKGSGPSEVNPKGSGPSGVNPKGSGPSGVNPISSGPSGLNPKGSGPSETGSNNQATANNETFKPQ